MTDGMTVAVRGLSRAFQEGAIRHSVLDAVDLDIDAGQSVALRGRSGTGKSTLLNLMCGIDSPDSGTVEVGGFAMSTASERDRTLFRRRCIGFVYQAFNLVPTLTVGDNVRLVLELNGIAQATARVEELLLRVGLADRAESFPDLLSGGEQQRVAIARALAHRPQLVLADEPTGNLDDRSADSVLELLAEAVAADGSTLVVATHSHAVAARCDRVIELKDGKLVAASAP